MYELKVSVQLKIAFDAIKEAFSLLKKWNSFHLSGKRLDYLHLKGFSQI
jgi:hypothetical protein